MIPVRKHREKQYLKEDVVNAIAEIKAGKTYTYVSKKYNIPLSTLSNKVNAKYNLNKERGGPPPALSESQEQQLLDFIIKTIKIGFGLPKRQIPYIVKSILDKAEVENSTSEKDRIFKDNLPSKAWVYKLLSRFPVLSSRMSENFGRQRADISEKTVREWYDNFEIYLQTEHSINARLFFAEENQSRIFTCDEFSFPLYGTTDKLREIALKSTRNSSRIGSDTTKEQITVLACTSANGDVCKPFVIFPVGRPHNFGDLDPDYFVPGCTADGFISTDGFFGWLVNFFYESIKDKVEFPIILLMDCHPSHMNLAVAEFCKDKNIIVYCFLPNANPVIQPLDIAVFGTLKKQWNEEVEQYKRDQGETGVQIAAFYSVFYEAWRKCVDEKEDLTAGFRSAGILPFNPDIHNYDLKIFKNTIIKETRDVGPNLLAFQDQVCVQLALDCLENALPTQVRDDFRKKWGDKNPLCEPDTLVWKIYKSLKELEDGKLGCAASTSATESSVVTTTPVTETTTTDASTSSRPSVSASPLNSFACPSTYTLDGIETGAAAASSSFSASSTLASTSSETSALLNKAYVHGEISPFEKFQQIVDHVAKVAKGKCIIPPSLDDEEECEIVMVKQKGKDGDEARKAERKELNEQNRSEEETCPKRLKTGDASADTEPEGFIDDIPLGTGDLQRTQTL